MDEPMPGAVASTELLGLLPPPDYPAGSEGMLGEDCWTRAQVLVLLAAERKRISALMETHCGIRLATVEYLETMRQGPSLEEWAELDANDRGTQEPND